MIGLLFTENSPQLNPKLCPKLEHSKCASVVHINRFLSYSETILGK